MSEGARVEPDGTETPATTSGVGELVPQPHGGALRRGNPGNRGGGLPPSRVRALAREILFPRLETVLKPIADGVIEVPLAEKCPSCGYEATHEERVQAIKQRVRPAEQVRAMEVLGKLGMGTTITVDDVKARMIAQVRAIHEWGRVQGLAKEQVEALLTSLDAVWV